MCYDVHELNSLPLLSSLFIFLSTSQARPHSVVTLLSLIQPPFFLLPSRCNLSPFSPPSHICASAPSFRFYLPRLSFPVSLPWLHLPSIYSTIPFFCPAFSLSLCVPLSLPLSLSPSLSSAYVFALAQLSAACSSCTHTQTHTHTHTHTHALHTSAHLCACP